MKFRAERAEFADAVTWALRTVGTRASLPALSGVKLVVADDRLTLLSTDLEMSSQLSIGVQAERDGEALVLGQLLGNVVRSLPNAAISAEADGDRLHLVCGRANFQLRLMPSEDFPPPPEVTASSVVAVMPAITFAETVGQVARAASTDDARPVLTGVILEASAGSLTAAATDSYRLAVRTVPWKEGPETTALVPRRALEEARRSAAQLGTDVRIAIEPSQVTFDLGDRRLTSRLIEGSYPPYRQLIPPSHDRLLVVDRAELSEVVRRVSVVGESNTTSTPITLHVTGDTVRVTAGSGEVGQAEESLQGALEGEPIEIGFNPRYLSDGLEVTGGERVRLEFRDELKPAVLRAVADDEDATSPPDEYDDFLYLLMPVRL